MLLSAIMYESMLILVRAACVRCHGTKCPLLTAFFSSVFGPSVLRAPAEQTIGPSVLRAPAEQTKVATVFVN